MAACCNPSALPGGQDPLLRSSKTANQNNNAIDDYYKEDAIEQTLGGETYRIDTSQFMDKMIKKNPLWKKALTTSVMIVATPVLIPTIFLYMVSMYIGPSWYRNMVTATLVKVFMKEVGDLFDDDRKELLQGIGPNDTILDLGAGSGYYLKYLCQGKHLVAIEPVANCHPHYKQLALEAGMTESQIELHASDLETYVQNNPQMRSNYDWIILGNVLCEVDDQISTLDCLDQLLKPNSGRVYFSEHIGCPKGTWSRKYQDLINPLWRVAGAGCNCNRDSLMNIRNTKGWQVISWNFFGLKVCMGPFVLGLAMKKEGKDDATSETTVV